jgi:TatD DNase family protein
MLIDIGVNLTHSSFRDDLDEVIMRACGVGVDAMVVTGTTEADSRAALELARQYPGVLYSTAGVHPHHASECSERTLDELTGIATQAGAVALGECGLDFYRNYSPRDVQGKWFEAQLELAAHLGLPVFLHQRDAHQEFVKIVGRYRDQLVNAVAHCFTGTSEELEAYVDLDLHVGITGWICDERRGHALQKSVARIPLNRLMIETDAPYLLPRDLIPKPKTKRNEPMYLPHICKAVSRYLDLDELEVALATTNTARAFFRLP